MIRIASGLLRGVLLSSPHGKQTRPSSERLRQGTFNVLRHHRWNGEQSILSDALVIDLFAGTGAWGLEAVSNGAREVCFVESHPSTLKTLNENLDKATHCFRAQELESPMLRVVKRDALSAYDGLPETRLIFCDPPYEQGWFEKILRKEDQSHRLVPQGVFLYEAASKEEIPSGLTSLKHYDTKNYGDSSVHFFIKLS